MQLLASDQLVQVTHLHRKRNLQSLDVVHPSSLGLDRDGHYVASFQAMDEITKINSRTGEIVWRFGGRHNEFTI